MNSNIESSNFACWTFLESYTDTFARNFTTCTKEVVSGSLSEKKLLQAGTELFSILFLHTDEKDHVQSVYNVFRKILQGTNKGYIILSRTWMLMARDIIDCLLRQNSELGQLEMFLNRINDLSELLLDIYFEISQVPSIHVPETDLTSKEYKEIIAVFRNYLNGAETNKHEDELRIHTYYRSIPVDLNASVLEVNTSSVTFKVHPYEAVALSSMKMGLIKSSQHLAVFRAHADAVDINERTATFTHFIPIDHPVERRAYIRVEPKNIVKARIIFHNDTISGRICDLSEVAAAVYVRNINSEQYPPGTIIRFETDLPSVNENIQINCQGTVTNLYRNVKGDADAYKMIVHWDIDRRLQSRLTEYISRRQSEIMKELKELSQGID